MHLSSCRRLKQWESELEVGVNCGLVENSVRFPKSICVLNLDEYVQSYEFQKLLYFSGYFSAAG